MSSSRPTKQKAPEFAPPKKDEAKEDVRLCDDTSFDNSFYRGVGGEYALDDQGRRVPVKAKGDE